MCPRPGITSRSLESASASASQTASKASEWPPETTSTGKPAEARVSRGISASHEGLSRLSSSTPCMSSGGRSSGVPYAEPAPPRNSLRKSSDGISDACAKRRSPLEIISSTT